MTTLSQWLTALPAMLAMSLGVWALATARRNAGLVDIFWSGFFLAGVTLYAAASPAFGARALLVLILVAVWALRLSVYLAARNWNAPEDRRYRAIRARNEPGFTWKSVYLVFGLQAVLAWLIAAPLAVAAQAPQPLGTWDAMGAALTLFGIKIGRAHV